MQLAALLAAHAAGADDEAWTHRNAATGGRYTLPSGSDAEKRVAALVYLHCLQTGRASTLQARVLPLSTQLSRFLASPSVHHDGASVRASHGALLAAFRRWSGDWDSTAQQVAAMMGKLAYTTERSHGVRYWRGVAVGGPS